MKPKDTPEGKLTARVMDELRAVIAAHADEDYELCGLDGHGAVKTALISVLSEVILKRSNVREDYQRQTKHVTDFLNVVYLTVGDRYFEAKSKPQ